MTKVLTRVIAVAAALAALSTWLVSLRLDQFHLWLATTGLGVAMLAASFPATRWVLPRLATSTEDTLPGYAGIVVFASLLKAAVAAAGVLVFVRLLGFATWTTFGFVGTWYVLLTIAQASVAGYAFWASDVVRSRTRGNVDPDAAGSTMPAPPS